MSNQTHFTPATGSRRTRYRKNKNAAAERQHQTTKDAYQASGEALRQARLSLRPSPSPS